MKFFSTHQTSDRTSTISYEWKWNWKWMKSQDFSDFRQGLLFILIKDKSSEKISGLIFFLIKRSLDPSLEGHTSFWQTMDQNPTMNFYCLNPSKLHIFPWAADDLYFVPFGFKTERIFIKACLLHIGYWSVLQ